MSFLEEGIKKIESKIDLTGLQPNCPHTITLNFKGTCIPIPDSTYHFTVSSLNDVHFVKFPDFLKETEFDILLDGLLVHSKVVGNNPLRRMACDLEEVVNKHCVDYDGNMVYKGDVVEYYDFIGCKGPKHIGIIKCIGDMNENARNMPYIVGKGAWSPLAIRLINSNDRRRVL